jgi:hypothetical protein
LKEIKFLKEKGLWFMGLNTHKRVSQVGYMKQDNKIGPYLDKIEKKDIRSLVLL